MGRALRVEAGSDRDLAENLRVAHVFPESEVAVEEHELEPMGGLRALISSPRHEAVGVEGVVDPLVGREAKLEAELGPQVREAVPHRRALRFGGAVLAREVFPQVLPLRGQAGVELEGVPVDLRLHLALEGGEGTLELTVADDAPRTHDVGDEIDAQLSRQGGVAHGRSLRTSRSPTSPPLREALWARHGAGMRRCLLLGLLGLLGACASAEVPVTPSDASNPVHDSGTAGVDAEVAEVGPVDASAPMDAAAPADTGAGLDTGAVPDASEPDAGPPRPLRILFVGNSYTYFHQLPDRFSTLAGSPAPEVRMVATGGQRLVGHAADDALTGVFGEGWDVVVLQEQSQILGFPASQPERQASIEAARTLAGRADPARIVLFVTWGRERGDARNPQLFPDFATMQDRLNEGYLAVRDALMADGRDVEIAPVGPAFRLVQGADPNRFAELYSDDGSHPSPLGSSLAALVLNRVIFGTDPSGSSPLTDVDAAAWSDIVTAARTVRIPE